MSVTKDPTSGKYVPANAAEWAELLEVTGVKSPLCIFGFTEIMTAPMTAPTYQQTITGWIRRPPGVLRPAWRGGLRRYCDRGCRCSACDAIRSRIRASRRR